MPSYQAGEWTSLRLRNFRRFEDTGTVDLAPITLFLGRNSSGKTSLLRAPLLIKQFVSPNDPDDVSLSGPFVDYGSYKELVHEGQVRKNVIVEFTLEGGNRRRLGPAALTDSLGGLAQLLESVHVELELHWNVRNSVVQFDELRFFIERGSRAEVVATRLGPAEFLVSIPGLDFRTKVAAPLALPYLRYVDVVPGSGDRARNVELLLFGIFNLLQTATQRIVQVGPLRQMPDRAYRTEQGTLTGSAGSVVSMLEKTPDANSVVSEALAVMDMARTVSLKKLAPGYVGIVLTDTASGRQDNLADVGFGVSQVLPIIATLATAQPRSTVLIEQPELHLHPDAQGKLADVLLNLSRRRRLTLAIETHSEHMLLRLQRRVAEGSLDPADVAVYFVDGGKVTRSPLTEAGNLTVESVPQGFFEEEWSDAVELAKAAALRRKQ